MKINNDLLQDILRFSKDFLLKNSYEKLTMRRIAEEFHISVGTLYNCFASKEILVANIILADWMAVIHKVDEQMDSFENCDDGLRFLFFEIRKFSRTYSGVFQNYTGAVNLNDERHALLVEQISTLIHRILERFGQESYPDPSTFLAETLLTTSQRDSLTFDEIQVFFDRIIYFKLQKKEAIL